MKKKIIFDVAVLINAEEVGNVYRTGLYRVTDEILKGISKSEKYEIYLFDFFLRERLIYKYIIKKYKNVKVLTIDSLFYKLVGYSFFNLSDYFKQKETRCKRNSLIEFYRFIKNIAFYMGKLIKYLDRIRRIKIRLKPKYSDIYFSSYYPLPVTGLFSNLEKIIIIHDLIAIIHPEYFYDLSNKVFMENILDSISADDKVLCVSESTKNDLLKYRKDLSERNVNVIYLAASERFFPNNSREDFEKLKKKYNLNDKFYLSVCTIEPRKNLELILNAYSVLLRKCINIPKLVLTGTYGWKSEELLIRIQEINLIYGNKIILTDFVSDDDLAILYSNTLCFIYPSLYEGFGLPPLEAMQCGAPVITSNNSSLPEVVGLAGVLINGNDINELCEIMEYYMNETNRFNITQKSIERSKLFTWQNTVKKIIDILN